MKNWRIVLGMAVGVGGSLLPARAQVFIKPTGFKAMPVRVQSLHADVDIVGAVAVTHWSLKAQLETARFGGGVSDFVLARPVDAKVTAFSVLQGQNTLFGNVVERAAIAPVVTFPTAKDDPLLLSGLTERNSFHATIYPFPAYWDEATFSGTWVQLLHPSANGAATFRLPLLSLKGATMRVPELNVRVSVHDGAWGAASNSYELPVGRQGDARVWTLGQKGYRVTHDLSFALRPARALSPLPFLMSADGHFALSFVAPATLRNPRVVGVGIQSSTASSRSVRRGELVSVMGTFAGDPNTLRAHLSADGLRREMPLIPVPNEAARGLWATAQINALAARKGSRAQVIALSKRFAVASPYTTWLCVGDEDLRIYRHALVSAQLDPLVREYWMSVARGQEKGARAARLQHAIAQISRGNGLNVEDELYVRLGSAYKYVLWQKYDDYSPNKKQNHIGADARITRLRARMQRYVQAKSGVKPESSVDWYTGFNRDKMHDLREKIKAAYRAPHPDYAQISKWEHRFAQLYGSTDVDPRLEFWRVRVNSQNLELQTTRAEKSGDKTLLAALQKERKEITSGLYFTNNIGDPPIYVQAPADAREVVAVMPDGQVKTLDYNAAQKRWEGNYDVPVGTRDGDYRIHIVAVFADGSRHVHDQAFRVDTHAPTGRGVVQWSPRGDGALRLEVAGGGDVAFVSALLPWGEKVALLPSTQAGNSFFGLAQAPAQWRGQPIAVHFVLADGAHNTTAIAVEATEGAR